MPFSPIEWPSASELMMCRVPWDAQYTDTVYFGTEEKRDAYFAGLLEQSAVWHLSEMTYLKPNEPVQVNIPYSSAYTYNYLIVHNPELPVPNESTPPKLFYFVTSVSYVSPNTTALELQLDVFQTYFYTCQFGTGFLERGHWPMKELWEADGRDVSTIQTTHLRNWALEPEGLDAGSEYFIVNHEWKDISNPGGDGWRVVIVSTVDLANPDWGTVDAPKLTTAKGQQTDGLISGCNVYTMPASSFEQFMADVSDCPWISKGIVSITAFPSGVLSAGPTVEIGTVTANFLGKTNDLTAWFSPAIFGSNSRTAFPKSITGCTSSSRSHTVSWSGLIFLALPWSLNLSC